VLLIGLSTLGLELVEHSPDSLEELDFNFVREALVVSVLLPAASLPAGPTPTPQILQSQKCARLVRFKCGERCIADGDLAGPARAASGVP